MFSIQLIFLSKADRDAANIAFAVIAGILYTLTLFLGWLAIKELAESPVTEYYLAQAYMYHHIEAVEKINKSTKSSQMTASMEFE